MFFAFAAVVRHCVILLGMLSSERSNLPVLLETVPLMMAAVQRHVGDERLERSTLDVLEHVVMVRARCGVGMGLGWRA